MRILLISGANIAASGGDAVHTLGMAGGLAGNGARVTLVLRGYFQGPGRPGIRVVGLPATGNKYLDALIWPVLVCLVAVFLTLLRDYDAVYIRDSIYEAPLVLLLRLFGKTVILEVNAVTAEDLGTRKRATWKVVLSRRLQRRACLSATLVLPVTTSLARWLAEQGVDSGRIAVVPNGANPYLYRPRDRRDCLAGLGLDPSKRLLCFAGNLAPWQGGEMILDAFGRLARNHPEAALLMIGDGQVKKELEDKARRLGVGDRVVFAGRLPYDRVPLAINACVAGIGGGWYGGNKIVARRFRYTGSSALKVYSYLACGLPVVVPDIPDLAGTVRRERCGQVVAPDRVEKLEEALRVILEDPRHWAEAGLRGRAYIEREASWECRAAQVLSLVERAKGFRTGGVHK